MEGRIAQLNAQIAFDRDHHNRFGVEIECAILGCGSIYDWDGDKKLKPIPEPRIGDIVIAEYWCTWLCGADPSGFKIAVRVVTDPDEHGKFKATSLGSYVRLPVRNEFYAFDSKCTRSLAH